MASGADGSRGSVEKRIMLKNHAKTKSRRLRAFYVEWKESFLMATNALASHKLRSSLTLLGILVGVFSIIVVMTAMRAMRAAVEKDLDTLGGQTFAVQKFPAIMFDRPSEKLRRRKDISFEHGMELKKRATLAQRVGLEQSFSAQEILSTFDKAPPNASLIGQTPDGFPARNWVVQEGRVLLDADVDGARDVCVLGSSLAEILFPFGSAVGERADTAPV